MIAHYCLYLGSKSYSRKIILQQAHIPFVVVHQDVDETSCNWSLSLQEVTLSIARYKMDHLVIPAGKEEEICFVLTADTLSEDIDQKIHGKPIDKEDAYKKLIIARQGMQTGTAFCIEKRVYQAGRWHCIERREGYVSAFYTFDVPDQWIETYLSKSIGLTAAGAIAIEEFGMQFLKEVRGSYSAIMGLPIYEIRELLENLGFFN